MNTWMQLLDLDDAADSSIEMFYFQRDKCTEYYMRTYRYEAQNRYIICDLHKPNSIL